MTLEPGLAAADLEVEAVLARVTGRRLEFAVRLLRLSGATVDDSSDQGCATA